MFKNILIPMSSEFYDKEILERSFILAEKFNSKVKLLYIIEEKTLNQTDKMQDPYRTPQDKAETKKEILAKQKQAASSIVFHDADYIFKNKEHLISGKIAEGEFSTIVKNELEETQYDLILMGFEKESILRYRLLEEVNIPIWIEGKSDKPIILAVCSNLAPNQKVPEISIELSKALGWNLHMLYIVDIEDCVQVDQNCERSDKKPERDLMFNAQSFINHMKNKGITVTLTKGSLEKETIKTAKEINASLVIVGREQKRKGILGLPAKNIKKKIAEKSEYSILFVN
jgi:nucleotide-binding universal stress UspA family protein